MLNDQGCATNRQNDYIVKCSNKCNPIITNSCSSLIYNFDLYLHVGLGKLKTQHLRCSKLDVRSKLHTFTVYLLSLVNDTYLQVAHMISCRLIFCYVQNSIRSQIRYNHSTVNVPELEHAPKLEHQKAQSNIF